MATQLDADTQDLARGGFSGVFATWVFSNVGDRRTDLDAVASDLDDQADQINQLRQRAHHAQEARNHDISDWNDQYSKWQDWVPPVGAPR